MRIMNNDNIYKRNWQIFEENVLKILNDNHKLVSFQTIYTAVYNICSNKDNITRFTDDMVNFVQKHATKLDENKVKCINDVMLFYTNKTGNKINEKINENIYSITI